jgi:drug/metabolite transporter (DMT)-like permease
VTPARRADVQLIAACFLWGVSFVIVKDAVSHSSPLAFVAMRFALAALVFAPFAGLRGGFSAGELRAGALLAGLLGIGFIMQTAGLVHTTPSRSAFIIAVSSILAPPIAMVALRERPRLAVGIALALAAVGTWLVTGPDSGGLNRGDLLTLVTAVAFGGQIVATTALARRYPIARLVWLEIAGTALLAAVAAPFVEDIRVEWTPSLIGALVFTAIGASVVALLLQLRAQQQMSSARAAVLFCSETLFAAVTAWLVIGERLTATQWLGGALVLAGLIVAEWQPSHKSQE